MRLHRLKSQAGYTLLLTVVALMGIGGMVITGFTQDAKRQAEQQRYLHNQRVLEEAKAALLQYAYNYPNNFAGGPGRLPCADIDNDGDSETAIGDCITLGRLPWAEPLLGLHDLRDADGQRLWYAVSDNFAAVVAGGNIVNSTTPGNITVRVPAGNVKYDGSLNNPTLNPKYGIAAVIIAPGPEIDRNGTMQNRSVGNGDDPFDYTAGDDFDEDSDPGIIDPINYLDLVLGTEDNADFTQDSGVDGFIFGSPDLQANPTVNDQIIVITAEEVTRMAEKAALEAYRDAINAYQVAAWATPTDRRYPWLNNYSDIPVANIEIYHADPANPDSTFGRVPYMNYYVEHDSPVVISDLQVTFDVSLNSLTDLNGTPNSYIDAFRTSGVFGGVFGGPQVLDISDSNLSFVVRNFDGSATSGTDNTFTMVAQTTAPGSTVSAILNAAPNVTRSLYFWDGCPTCFEPVADGWELCDLPANNAEDCARDEDSPYNFEGFSDWDDHADIAILHVRLTMRLDEGFEVEFNQTGIAAPGLPTPPAAGTNARITTAHNLASITRIALLDTAETDAKNFIEVVVEDCEGDTFVGSSYDPPPGGGSFTCTPDLVATTTLNQFDVTVDYYPPLPMWVYDNNWNNSIMMAYADDLKPGDDNICTMSVDCLTITEDFNGPSDSIRGLLLGAGANPTTQPQLTSLFDGENSTPVDDIFEVHPSNPNGGKDAVLILN